MNSSDTQRNEQNESSHGNAADINMSSLVPEWSRIVVSCLIGIAFILGIPGNLLVICLHVKLTTRALTDWMLFYLAVCDVTSLLICAPCFILFHHDLWHKFAAPSWVCKLNYTVMTATFLTSGVTILFLAVYRYKATSYGTLLRSVNQPKGHYLGIGIAACCSFFAAQHFFLVHNNSKGMCVYNDAYKTWRIITYSTGSALCIVMCSVTCMYYIRLFLFFRRWRKVRPITGNDALASDQSRLKSLQTTTVVISVSLVFFLLSMLPVIASVVITALKLRTTMVFFFSRLFFVNNCANPVLYFCLSASFRRAVANCMRNVRQ